MSQAGRTSILPQIAAGLSQQLRRQLEDMGRRVAPYASELRHAFDRRLRTLEFPPLQRAALTEITPAAAALLLSRGKPLESYLEEVEYRGRRLAKLGLTPGAVLAALHEFDRLFEARIARDRKADLPTLLWVRDQLHFCTILTLNNAFYQVRDAESQAFYELFRAETEAASLEQMLARFADTLKFYSGAEDAVIHLFPASAAAARKNPLYAQPRSFAVSARASASLLLDPGWRARYRFVWSIPMREGGRLRGVMQFAFLRPYDWLPREKELLAAAAERCWRAAEKAQLIADLRLREDQIRKLAEHMVEVEEAERRRISRELHDEAGQSLLCVRLQLEMAEQDVLADLSPAAAATARQRLAEARDLVDHSIVEIRRLIAALSPAILEQIGLAAALRQLVQRFRRLHPKTSVTVKLPRRLELSKRAEIIVYRLAQECFNNIAKYSSATRVNLSVESADNSLCLQIEDNGVGFDVQEALSRQDRYGLSGMRERVALLGGSLELRSRKREDASPRHGKTQSRANRPGTLVRVWLPVTEDASLGERAEAQKIASS